MDDRAALLNQLRIDRNDDDDGDSGPPWLRWAGGIGALLLIAIGLWLWLKPPPAPMVSVALARPAATANGAGSSLLDAAGYVVARRAATVSAKITGLVTEVLIEEGSRVEAGQIVARLDDTNIRATLEQARAQQAAAQASTAQIAVNLANAERDVVRKRGLVAQQFISSAELDNAETALAEGRVDPAAAVLLAPMLGQGNFTSEIQVELDMDQLPSRTIKQGGEATDVGHAGARIGDGTRFDAQVTFGAGCRIGPYARIRPGSTLAAEVHIGNFVEVKASAIGDGSKANHLSYVGDSSVGRNVNIGAGTITCNYDGANKHRTVIEDDVHIGSDVQLVAPVRVARGVTVGAGTTVWKDSPEGGLIINPKAQEHRAGWQRPRKVKK